MRRTKLLFLTLGLIGILAGVAYPAEPADVRFHKDVLPFLRNRCQYGHRPGDVASFPLMSYEQARTLGKANQGSHSDQ